MTKKHLGFNLAVLGMIASGKDTQVGLLMKRYNLQPVKTGLYTRELLKEKSENGDWARMTAGKGKPLPVSLMKEFLKKQIENKPKNKDLVFVGGPRLKPEAQLVRKLLKENNQKLFVVYITLPDKIVYSRSIERKSNKNLDSVYKVFDTKNLISKRIKWHKEQVGKTVKYFNELDILKKINGNQSIKKVDKDIEKAILAFKKK